MSGSLTCFFLWHMASVNNDSGTRGVGGFWILPSARLKIVGELPHEWTKLLFTANHILFYFFNAYIWSKTHGKAGTLPPTYIFVIVACGGTAHCDIATTRKHVLWRRLRLSCFLGFEKFTVVFDRCQVDYHSSNIASGSWSNHQWPLLLTWFNFNPSMDK